MGALSTLASIAVEETKKNGKFKIPDLVTIKTRKKPATKAGKREMFGKTVLVKAKPAKTEMAPMMKSTVMTKSALLAAIAESCEVKRGVASKALSTLASIAVEETKKNGKFKIPDRGPAGFR